MIIYIIIYILILFLLFLSLFKKIEREYVFLIIISFILIFFATFRYGIGTDYESYVAILKTGEMAMDDGTQVEWGYLLLNKIVRYFDGEFWVLAFFSSLIMFLCTFKVLSSFGINRYMGLAVYISMWYIGMNYNIIRHGMAVALTWVAFTYIKSKKPIKFLLLIIIAGAVQKVAYVFIPFYWLLRLKISFKVALIIIPACMIIGNFLNIFQLPVLSYIFKDNYRFYYYTQRYYSELGSSTAAYGISIGFILNYLWIIVFYKLNKFIFTNQEQILINALIYGLCIIGLLNSIGVFVERLGGLLLYSLIIIIPMIFSCFKTRKYIIGSFVAIILYCSFYYFNTLRATELSGEYQYIPYRSIFSVN